MFDLIVKTSTSMPSDVKQVLKHASMKEQSNTVAGFASSVINLNVDMANENVSPICQDTGMPTFLVKTPIGQNQLEIKKAIQVAVQEATKLGKLRRNSVDPITGKNSGENVGPGVPIIQCEQWEKDSTEVRLILKGGGCENKNIQYSLPCQLDGLGRADRSLDGVRKCVMHAVYQAQGQGCSSGFIGVGIGGDRTSGYKLAKDQLFRDLRDENPDPVLKELEDYVLQNADSLKIGPMGFGGKVTLLGCKIGKIERLPASYFVSVAYNCWAFRRLGVMLDSHGDVSRWLYIDKEPSPNLSEKRHISMGENRVTLRSPVSQEDIQKIKVGDLVVVNGIIHTGRDAFHLHIMKNDLPKDIDIKDGILYHCGPVIVDDQGSYKVTAAGPTTSMREEPYQADVIKKLGLRVIIGKGGMGPKTLKGLKENGAIYLNAIGGAAQFYSKCIKRVLGVHFLEEMGTPEAMWHLEVEGFPAICTMDMHGNSTHEKIQAISYNQLKEFI